MKVWNHKEILQQMNAGLQAELLPCGMQVTTSTIMQTEQWKAFQDKSSLGACNASKVRAMTVQTDDADMNKGFRHLMLRFCTQSIIYMHKGAFHFF